MDRISAHLRSYEEAAAYPAHQFLSATCGPRKLWDIERPWFLNPRSGGARFGQCG